MRNSFEGHNPGDCPGLGQDIRMKEAVAIALAFFEQSSPDERTNKKRRAEMRELVEVYGPRKLVREVDREELIRLVKVFQGRGLSVFPKLGYVKRFFELMRQEGVITVNPVQYRRLPFTMRPRPVKPIITEEQYRRLLDTIVKAKPGWVNDGWAITIMGAWETGLRSCDVATLRWNYHEDGTYVDFNNEIICARPSKLRRKKQRLEIPIGGEYLEALRELARTSGDEQFVAPMLATLFLCQGHARTFTGQFKKLAIHCGMDEYTFHCFRHSFVTRCLRAGVSPIVIGSLTGQSLRMIEHYSRVDKTDKVAALDAIRNANHADRIKRLGYQPPV